MKILGVNFMLVTIGHIILVKQLVTNSIINPYKHACMHKHTNPGR